MGGEIIQSEKLEKLKELAVYLARWDKRIEKIVAFPDSKQEGTKFDLICCFDPEPLNDSAGFFWIANLLTRLEVEALDERLKILHPFDLGFEIGEQVFLPNGIIIRSPGGQTVVWQNHEE
ncbi:MAG: hypothetical protein HS100_04440 [Anaerolineales bacterium]|nr:hypothetical protein [Anaerolineales bacterium]